MVTGSGARAASDSSALPSPRSVSTAGWMPWASSRRSARPVWSSPASLSSRSTTSSAPAPAARRRASWAMSAAETNRCCAPSWRSRSRRRRAASAASTIRAREAVSSRAWAASASLRRSRSSASRRSVTSKMTPSRHARPRSSRTVVPRSRTQRTAPSARTIRYSIVSARRAATAARSSTSTHCRSSGCTIENSVRVAPSTKSSAGYPVMRAISSPISRIDSPSSSATR